MFWPPRPPWRSPAPRFPAPTPGLREALPHLPADPGVPGRGPARVPQRRRRGARGGAELPAARGAPRLLRRWARRGPWGTGDPRGGGPAPGWGVAGGDLGQGRGSGVGTRVCRCLERVLDWGPPGPGRGPGAGLRLGFVQRTRANRESQGPGSGGKGLESGLRAPAGGLAPGRGTKFGDPRIQRSRDPDWAGGQGGTPGFLPGPGVTVLGTRAPSPHLTSSLHTPAASFLQIAGVEHVVFVQETS